MIRIAARIMARIPDNARQDPRRVSRRVVDHPQFVAYIKPAHRHRRPLPVMAAVFVIVMMLSALAITPLALWIERTPYTSLAAFEAGWLLIALFHSSIEIPLLALAVWVFYRQPPTSLLGPDMRLFRRGVIAGGATTVVVFLATLSTLFFAADEILRSSTTLDHALLYVTAAILLIASQSTAEELMFRGFLLQQVAVRFKNPVAWALIPSIVFGVLHFDPTLPRDGQIGYVFATTIFGLATCYATWRTGSLGFAVGLHIVNNWIAFLLIGEIDDPLSVLSLFLTTPGGDYEMAGFAIGQAAIIVAVMETPGSPLRRYLHLSPRAGSAPNTGSLHTSFSENR